MKPDLEAVTQKLVLVFQPADCVECHCGLAHRKVFHNNSLQLLQKLMSRTDFSKSELKLKASL